MYYIRDSLLASLVRTQANKQFLKVCMTEKNLTFIILYKVDAN